MARILVAGLINIETTLKVERFPIPYTPVKYPFFGVGSSVSGVGYNVAKALSVLGDKVDFLSLIGRDYAGSLVRQNLLADGIPDRGVLPRMDHTAQSVVLYDQTGRRQIYTDLKDIQERHFPLDVFEIALAECELAVLCNINFSRPFLASALRLGKPVATDVHTIASLEDEYNQAFMAAAEILFMSDELLPVPAPEWASDVMRRYSPRILVIGLGASGALLSTRGGGTQHVPAETRRTVVNTIGAGDALFSAFLHCYLASGDAQQSLEKAVLYAAHKIGAISAADGFLDARGLEALFAVRNRGEGRRGDTVG